MNTAVQMVDYAGSRISLKGEMISLTGMWKASGSDPQKAPAKWRALPGSQAFIEHVADIVGKSDIISAGRGRNGVTWAHWQIAMAYAKYLSPEFHMWCNTVVRERMEGRAASVDFPSELIEMIKRTDGIVRMLANKVTKIERAVGDGSHQEPAAFTITVEPRKGNAA
ncbi:KilA-N domain-containing protein [Nitratireductor aquimarinus]|uniref:KilA-N domain-containing protein n=1 Tax=Nitratireductor aquimarinus TaxID=889300 RepID=A0ABU4AJ92_9HYPH|nr:KilA-N domain-containing protein [Nitratireductor aquimarinus]MDV6226313.1 KilA-N domain-containing protein [Nitratireductor aquimarinus]